MPATAKTSSKFQLSTRRQSSVRCNPLPHHHPRLPSSPRRPPPRLNKKQSPCFRRDLRRGWQMSRSWQDLCVTSATRSLDDFDTINYCTTGILVFFFVATGLACGCRYWQWRRLSSATKAELWELYGVFCALGSLGCAAGVVACLCLMLGNK